MSPTALEVSIFSTMVVVSLLEPEHRLSQAVFDRVMCCMDSYYGGFLVGEVPCDPILRLPAGYSTHQGSQSYGSRDAFWLVDGRWPLQRWLDGKSQTTRLFARKYRLLVMGWGEFPANAACAPSEN